MIPTGVELLTSLTMLGYAPTSYLRKNLVEHKDQLLILMSAIADLDVLCALAESYVENRSNAIFPTILDPNQPTQLSIEGGHHPFIFDKDSKVSVANELDIALSSDPAQSVNQFLLLTGPNTGGKTTYLKMIASLVLMAQIGAPVPARAMAITPLSLLTNMNVRDSLQKGESSFFAQSQRVAQILNVVENQPHVLLIMDEILNGTSPEEHTAIETAVLRHVLGQKYLGILATHDRKLQVLANELPGLANIHVDDKAANTFTVKLGPSVHRNAVQVLVDAGVPAAITAEAERSLKATDPSYPTSRGK
jgi:DNA mismatch repair ATPase MutS